MEQILKLKQKAKREIKRATISTSIKAIIKRLLQVMKSHIGFKNRIDRSQLFYEVFGVTVYQVTRLQEWIMWNLLKQSMNRMRRTTPCFIISQQTPISHDNATLRWFYWVACSAEDYKIYHDHIEHNITKMKLLEARCKMSIEQKWYAKGWRV